MFQHNIYEIDRLAQELSKAHLEEAENDRRAHLARQATAAARRADGQFSDGAPSQNQKSASGLSSKLLQLIRG